MQEGRKPGNGFASWSRKRFFLLLSCISEIIPLRLTSIPAAVIGSSKRLDMLRLWFLPQAWPGKLRID
jgi:hypothetical protein